MATAGNLSASLVENAAKLNDERLASLLERQVRDEESRWYGGFPNRFGLHEPGPAGGFAVERTPDGRLAGNGSGGIWGGQPHPGDLNLASPLDQSAEDCILA